MAASRARTRERNPAKHEYEVELGSGSWMIYTGTIEKTAIEQARQILREYPDERYVKVYHSYPSPGPQRRYVGTVARDGVLRRPA